MSIINLSGYEVYLNGTLCYAKEETTKTASELVIANFKLGRENEKLEVRAHELQLANEELKKALTHQKKYVSGLEKIIFMVFRKIRQPIASILGASKMLSRETSTPEHLTQLFGYIRT